LPETAVIDLAAEGFCEGAALFSERLYLEINKNLECGEQSILLLNRRGYHTFVSCPNCKKPVTCVNCSVPMTYHKTDGRLRCHYCSYSRPVPDRCPECGGEGVKLTGIGTQRIEEEISSLFPGARILRMDADTTYSRLAYEKGFAAFGSGQYDIMLGTQMIAKGLDFPNVTLVGVMSVDKALFTGDFRSYERTFSLITQVVGRCGRSGMRGRAFIQTFMPEHYVLHLAAAQDYEGFYRQESAMRKTLVFPPFCDTCLVEFSSAADRKADAGSRVFLEMMREKINASFTMPLRVIGPAKCLLERLNGKYRYRIIVKCRLNKEFRDFIAGLYKRTFKMNDFAGVTVKVDFNGDISI
jgi:primosomal protein N' (replication factor Y)